jgi:transcription initiation factor TFIIIB Brf1 subunit/transcription initiation factor TFIIB
MNQESNIFFSKNIEENINNNKNIYNKLTLSTLEDSELWDFYDDIGSSDNNTKKECCYKKELVQDCRGNLTCKNCGLVAEDELDRTFSTNNSNADIVSNSSNYNCPINVFFPESSRGTTIGGRGYSRMKTIHKWTLVPYKERSRREVFEFISRTCKNYNLEKAIIDNAQILWTNLSQIKHTNGDNEGRSIIIRGNNRESLIAACVYFGCKMKGKPRCPKEIAIMFGLGLTDVTGGCRKFLEIMGEDAAMYKITSSKANDYIERCGRKLKLQKKFINETIKIVKNIIKLDYASDHQPPSIAAGCLLLVVNMNNLDIDKEKISKVFQISQVTIGKIYDKILKYKKVITNDKSVERIYEQIQKIKLGSDTDDNALYSESNIFSVSSTINDAKLITTSPDEISTLKHTETETDTETMIKPGKPKKKYTKRKDNIPSI